MPNQPKFLGKFMKSDDIAYWSMIGSWASGIATFLAVVVSLYIANRKPKASLTCEVGLRTIFGKNEMGQEINEYGLAVKVINQSTIPIKIVSVGWQFPKKKYFYQLFGDIHSDVLPKKIEYGEQAFLWVKVDGTEWLKEFAEELKNYGCDIKKIRCAINLSTGKTFYFMPDKDFIKKIADLT